MVRITTKQLKEVVADYAATFEGWRLFQGTAQSVHTPNSDTPTATAPRCGQRRTPWGVISGGPSCVLARSSLSLIYPSEAPAS
jgi:hypothetical protein